MVKAKFKEIKSTGKINVDITGHALSAPEGKDLICCAVSAYGVQLAQMIENVWLEKWCIETPKITIDKGDILIRVKPKPEYYQMIFNMISVVEIGFMWLDKDYPEYVMFIPFGKTEDEVIEEREKQKQAISPDDSKSES